MGKSKSGKKKYRSDSSQAQEPKKDDVDGSMDDADLHVERRRKSSENKERRHSLVKVAEEETEESDWDKKVFEDTLVSNRERELQQIIETLKGELRMAHVIIQEKDKEIAELKQSAKYHRSSLSVKARSFEPKQTNHNSEEKVCDSETSRPSIEDATSDNWDDCFKEEELQEPEEMETSQYYNYAKDKEYEDRGCKKRTKHRPEKDFLKFNEIDGDLFTAPIDHSLAHCVSEDLRMGSGIAVKFRQDFKQVDKLLGQKKSVGEVAILEDNGRFIYYLITKKRSNGKPAFRDLERAVEEMKKHCVENRVKNLSIPLIGCGLDRLHWSDVRDMLKRVFSDTNITITVYNFIQEKDFTSASSTPNKSSLWVVEKEMNLVDIEAGTVLVYLGSVQGDVNRTITELDKKFNFILDYKRQFKKVGEIVEIEKKGEYLYGLIVKEKEEDLLPYQVLGKCLGKLRQIVRKHKCSYVGFEAFIDGNDELTVEKLITLLKFIFFIDKVEAWICWPSELWQKYKRKEGDLSPSRSIQIQRYSENEGRKSGEMRPNKRSSGSGNKYCNQESSSENYGRNDNGHGRSSYQGARSASSGREELFTGVGRRSENERRKDDWHKMSNYQGANNVPSSTEESFSSLGSKPSEYK